MNNETQKKEIENVTYINPKTDFGFKRLFMEGVRAKEEYKKSVLEYEDVQKAVQYAREQGREEGREEEKRQLARNMIAKGFAPHLVAEISGLTEDKVLSLVQQ